jgi:hypothetical protein
VQRYNYFLIIKSPGNTITEHPEILRVRGYHKVIITHPSGVHMIIHNEDPGSLQLNIQKNIQIRIVPLCGTLLSVEPSGGRHICIRMIEGVI